MGEVVGLEARTIHRLLEWSPVQAGFSRNADRPLDVDSLVVDETSMLDVSLAGDFSIADIANWCWARTYKWSGVSVEGLDHLQGWLSRMRARPASERGGAVPFKLPNMEKDAKAFAEHARKGIQR